MKKCFEVRKTTLQGLQYVGNAEKLFGAVNDF